MATDAHAQRETTVPVRDHFKVLAEWWHESTGYLSSPREKAAHPAYRLIVQMGALAVPLILEDLQEHRGGDWYVALREITGGSPVGAGEALTSEQVVQRWVEWAHANQFV